MPQNPRAHAGRAPGKRGAGRRHGAPPPPTPESSRVLVSAPEGGAAEPSPASPGKAVDSTPRGRDPLLAAICHDLRAPLAAVMMGANFVLQTTPDSGPSARSRRVLQAMLRSCRQMERLVRDFGDLSEIESDAVVLRPGLHDATEMMELAAEAGRQNEGERKVKLEVTRPPEPVLVRCDRDRMLRALAHIIDNAIRFAPNESTVSLRVEELPHEVHLGVTDIGPGLSDETLEHLHDRQWHAKRADRVGAGLGLAIARGFVLAHGGRMDVRSVPGETTFVLALPKTE